MGGREGEGGEGGGRGGREEGTEGGIEKGLRKEERMKNEVMGRESCDVAYSHVHGWLFQF